MVGRRGQRLPPADHQGMRVTWIEILALLIVVAAVLISRWLGPQALGMMMR